MAATINITLSVQEAKVLMEAIAVQKSVLKEARFRGTESYNSMHQQTQILDGVQERLSELVNKACNGRVK